MLSGTLETKRHLRPHPAHVHRMNDIHTIHADIWFSTPSKLERPLDAGHVIYVIVEIGYGRISLLQQ